MPPKLATGFRPARRKPTSPVFYPSATAPTLPVVIDLSQIPVLNQSVLPFCVEHAVAAYMMWLVYKTTGKVVTLSPRYLAAYTVQRMGITPQQALTYGTSLQDALELLTPSNLLTGDGCVGICEDSFFPNDTSLPIEQYLNIGLISNEATANAANYRASGFKVLADTEELTLQQAFATYGLVLYAIDVSANWYTPSWNYSGMFPIAPPNTQYPKVSGHLICGEGITATVDYPFRNSWSIEWGENGNGYFAGNDLPYVYEGAVIEGLWTPPVAPPTPSSPQPVVNQGIVPKIEQVVEEIISKI